MLNLFDKNKAFNAPSRNTASTDVMNLHIIVCNGFSSGINGDKADERGASSFTTFGGQDIYKSQHIGALS
jgi:hypothetical protein